MKMCYNFLKLTGHVTARGISSKVSQLSGSEGVELLHQGEDFRMAALAVRIARGLNLAFEVGSAAIGQHDCAWVYHRCDLLNGVVRSGV